MLPSNCSIFLFKFRFSSSFVFIDPSSSILVSWYYWDKLSKAFCFYWIILNASAFPAEVSLRFPWVNCSCWTWYSFTFISSAYSTFNSESCWLSSFKFCWRFELKLVRSLLYLACLRFSSFAAALISCRVFFSSSSLLTILIKFDFSSLLDLTELSCYRLFMFNLKAYPLISSSFYWMVFCNFAFSLVQEAISTR